MDFNAGEHYSNRKSQDSSLNDTTIEPSTTNPAPDLSSVPNHSSLNSPYRSCMEKCTEFCKSDKCPKYGKDMATVQNLLCNKQCTESCTKATCPEYMNQNAEDTVVSNKCVCSRPSTSKNTQSPRSSCAKKTCPSLSMRSLVKSTDTDDLSPPPLPEKQPVFPCAQQPACVVTKSEYYKTPEPIPYLLCPHCCRKIHVLATNCNKQIPSEPKCPMAKAQCSEPTAYSLSSSYLNPCQAKLCLQPTPPTPCPAETRHTCSRCQPQYAVSPSPQKAASTTYTTCPHFRLVNSPNAVKSVYLDVNELETPARSAANISINEHQQRANSGPLDFFKSLNSCAVGSCGHKEPQSDANYTNEPNIYHSCCKSGQQQMSCCVRSGHFNKPADQTRSPQLKLKEKTSTLVLYMEPNFTNQRSMSKTNVYYDCASSDTQKRSSKKLETADTFVLALKKLTFTAGQLLENFERAMKNKERSTRHQQKVKLKMTQKISSIQLPLPLPLPLPGPEMPVPGGAGKYVIPISLKLRSSSGKKLELDESKSNAFTPIRTAMILPQTSSHMRRY